MERTCCNVQISIHFVMDRVVDNIDLHSIDINIAGINIVINVINVAK